MGPAAEHRRESLPSVGDGGGVGRPAGLGGGGHDGGRRPRTRWRSPSTCRARRPGAASRQCRPWDWPWGRAAVGRVTAEWLASSELLILSNRGPLSVRRGADGTLTARRGGGGLVVTLGPGAERDAALWVAAAVGTDDEEAAERGLFDGGGARASGSGRW